MKRRRVQCQSDLERANTFGCFPVGVAEPVELERMLCTFQVCYFSRQGKIVNEVDGQSGISYYSYNHNSCVSI
jgi:hypothetical protein